MHPSFYFNRLWAIEPCNRYAIKNPFVAPIVLRSQSPRRIGNDGRMEVVKIHIRSSLPHWRIASKLKVRNDQRSCITK